jgi:hypothetical protein
MSATIRLSGGKAIAAIALIAGLAAFQFLAQTSTLSNHAAAQIKIHLASDYTRFSMPEIQQAAQSPSVSLEQVTDLVARIDPENIEIVSISARGSGDEIVARVEVAVAGGTPPDGRRVRYFKMRHSMLTGWTVDHPTTAASYYLSIP